MRSDTRLSALHAALKLTLPAAALGACAPSAPPEAPVAATADGASLALAERPPEPAAPDPPAEVECDARLVAAAENERSRAVASPEEPPPPAAPETKACCRQAIRAASRGEPAKNHAAYHGYCCFSARLMDDGEVDVQQACTPWGPPVPPRMRA